MIIETTVPNSSLSLTIIDQTRHYFGGYFHVKVLAFCDITLKKSFFDNDVEFKAAVKMMGTSIRFEKVLEKMAVPESDIESVRYQLTQTFRETAVNYLSFPDFACRFVRSEFQRQMTRSSNRKH